MSRSRPAPGSRVGGLWRYAAVAALGMSRRLEPPAPAGRVADRSVSSYEAPLAADPLQLGRAAQLPPFGTGNGLDALFWTGLARLDDDRVEDVLVALAQRDIAAWAAPMRRPPQAGRPLQHDLSVASLRLDDAQDVLMRVLATS